ncbi:MAG: ABC transporter permease, partial [Peptostreptococcales bacterium]
YVIAIIAGIYLYRTRMGLNLRAVGENAAAADASGIHVSLYKYIHIIAGGMLCGLGGAYLSLVYVPVWQENVTAGRGWIAVALVIFASWNPVKAIGAAFLFGGLDIIGFRLQGGNMIIPQYFIDMVPYIATILVLILKSNKNKKENRPPMNLGEPYFREER